MDQELTAIKEQLEAMEDEEDHGHADSLLVDTIRILATRLGLDAQPIIDAYNKVPKWYA